MISANADPRYYGDFSQASPTLKDDLYKILTSAHTPQSGDVDIITPNCAGQGCYRYKPETYKSARQYMFGWIHLEGDSESSYNLMESYCQKRVTNNDLSAKSPMGPMRIPDPIALNTEHIWPQSKFSKKFSEADQKPNIHILLPVISKVNSTRSNHPMGNVVKVTSQPCSQARLGKNDKNETVFEPSNAIKGDVARALFYFSVRFKLPISESEESAIRQWHNDDPPDTFEIWRNDEIFKIQNDRNPFIDMPELVDQIQDF